jgi:LysM repeat protein
MLSHRITHIRLHRLGFCLLIAGLLATALFGAASNARADYTYTVKAGDNLSKIARINNTTVAALVAANQAQYPCLAANAACLQVGWVLTIPGAGGLSAVSNRAGTYTVQSGDSLARIAQKLGVTLTALLDANKKDRPCLVAAKPCALQIGWVLKLPGSLITPEPSVTPTVSSNQAQCREGEFFDPVMNRCRVPDAPHTCSPWPLCNLPNRPCNPFPACIITPKP